MPAPYNAQRICQIRIAAEMNPENLGLRQELEELRDSRRKQQREKRQSTRQLTSPRASSSHISGTPISTHQTPIDLVEVTRQQLTAKDVLAENLRQLELYHARVAKAKAEKASDKRVAECEDAVVRRTQKVQEARDKLQCLNEQVARLSASRDQTVQRPNPDTSSSEKTVVEKIATSPLSGHKEGVDNVVVECDTPPALATDNGEKRVVTPVNPRDMDKADNNVQQPDQPLDPNMPEKPATLSNQSNADKIDERPGSGTKTAIAKSPSVSRTVIRHLPGTTIPDSEEEEATDLEMDGMRDESPIDDPESGSHYHPESNSRVTRLSARLNPHDSIAAVANPKNSEEEEATDLEMDGMRGESPIDDSESGSDYHPESNSRVTLSSTRLNPRHTVNSIAAVANPRKRHSSAQSLSRETLESSPENDDSMSDSMNQDDSDDDGDGSIGSDDDDDGSVDSDSSDDSKWSIHTDPLFGNVITSDSTDRLDNLTLKERIQAFSELPKLDLCTIPLSGFTYRQKQAAKKADLVKGFATSNIPLPDCLPLNFLEPCRYNLREIPKLSVGEALEEVQRLRLTVKSQRSTTTRLELQAGLEHHVKNKGCECIYYRTDSNSRRNKDVLLLQAEARALSLEFRQRDTSYDYIEGLKALVEKARTKERERGEQSKDHNLRYPTVNAIKPVVFILSRSSCGGGEALRRALTSKKPRIQRLLQQNRITGDLSSACYAFHHRDGGLNRPLSLNTRRGTLLHSIKKGLAKGSSGSDSHLILVLMGLDALTCHVDGCILWTDFLTAQCSGLKITVIIGESRHQWLNNEVLLVKSDWKGPYCGRYWLAADLKTLLLHGKDGPIRVYRQIHETWKALADGRGLHSEAIKIQGRPIRGRNGLRRSTKRNRKS